MAQVETITGSQAVKESGLDFKPFKLAVAAQFERMKNHTLYRTDVSKDWIWQTYINSFPEGSNPVFKERTEHDCNCCKGFIRTVGNVVAVIDGKLASVWDIELGGPYQVVADAMSEMVKANAITNIFLHTEPVAGVDKNFGQLLNGSSVQWNHFFVNLPKNVVVKKDDIGPKLNDAQTGYAVMKRGLVEITNDAIETVLDLIAQNSLYRGEEHKFAVTSFQKLKQDFDALQTELDRDLFVWNNVNAVQASVSRIKNTVIGTLLHDLSTKGDLEGSVRSFEAKVAPTNYKRPTALVTPKMVEQAKEKIQELGLMSALERRYAVLTDVSINNVLFADRSAKSVMTGNVFDELAASLPGKQQNFDKVEEVPIEKFINDILPRAKSLEVMFENQHTNNLVSLIAPVDPTAGQLFKWNNNFSWAYNGEVADSIKERVKKAGGNVSGDLCCRLAWSNRDDLDFHMKEPGGHEIYFGNKRQLSPSGGMLDVDMNVGGETRTPVENIFYTNKNTMREGIYELIVHQFNQREMSDVGFEVEFDFQGTIYRFAYDKPVRNKESISVIKFEYSKANGVKVLSSLPSTTTSKEVWSLPTQTFQKVNVVMFSPNHWDEQGVGNRHYFFMLDGCTNDGSARGFFNEFLKSELDPHRKAFEMVGSRMRATDAANQLSGLGFSTTQRNELLVKVTDSFTRVIKVMF